MIHRARIGYPGLVEVICGSMFSGKTEELLRRIRRAQIARQKVQLFKPVIDQRYSAEHIQSHDANRLPSICVEKPRDILKLIDDHTRVVGVDEAQFFDHSIVDVVQKLAYRGINVIVAGLDLDFRGRPFGPMPTLLCVAEDVTKLSAVCVICGNPASRSQRLPGTTVENIAVGEKDLYEARCRFCHDPHIERMDSKISGAKSTPKPLTRSNEPQERPLDNSSEAV